MLFSGPTATQTHSSADYLQFKLWSRLESSFTWNLCDYRRVLSWWPPADVNTVVVILEQEVGKNWAKADGGPIFSWGCEKWWSAVEMELRPMLEGHPLVFTQNVPLLPDLFDAEDL